jgi:hydrogenase nickel incorporation protein HypA/HybF
MHELSIAQDILDIVREHLPPEDHSRVRSVHLRIGTVAGVVVDSLVFGFGALTAGTPLENAVLRVESVPYRIRCGSCGIVPGDEQGSLLCPSCGGMGAEAVSGTELRVVAVDVDD